MMTLVLIDSSRNCFRINVSSMFFPTLYKLNVLDWVFAVLFQIPSCSEPSFDLTFIPEFIACSFFCSSIYWLVSCASSGGCIPGLCQPRPALNGVLPLLRATSPLLCDHARFTRDILVEMQGNVWLHTLVRLCGGFSRLPELLLPLPLALVTSSDIIDTTRIIV